EAGPLFLRAIEILETTVGSIHPDLASCLNNLAMMLEAQASTERCPLVLLSVARATRGKTLGSDHPDVSSRLTHRDPCLLYVFVTIQGKQEEAERLYERSLAIREKVLGPDHPAVAEALDNLAGLLNVQGRYNKANSLFRRSLEIEDKRLGPDHPGLAARLNHLAHLLVSQ
ncbi:unnamed protein product, partial [Scytosiphon promiscuus]